LSINNSAFVFVKDLLPFALSFLGNDQSRIEDINLLIQHICGFENYKQIIIHSLQAVSKEQEQHLKNALNELMQNKPVHYITQEKFFYNRKFHINEHCLIPRWDSEEMILKSLQLVESKFEKKSEVQILDLCSGSGCLGVSLACELMNKQFKPKLTMWDVSSNAMEVAVLNAKKHNTDFEVIVNDFLTHKTETNNKKYDIILFNPPYIKSGEIENLEEKIKHFEPTTALDGGADGLVFYKHIYAVLNHLLCKNGFLVMEHGFDQFDDIKNIFKNKHQVKAFSDLHCVVEG
jgi:release factor glutamine methyltransferase